MTEHEKQIHDLVEKLKSMGASNEDIIKVWSIALETANNIITGGTKNE